MTTLNLINNLLLTIKDILIEISMTHLMTLSDTNPSEKKHQNFQNN